MKNRFFCHPRHASLIILSTAFIIVLVSPDVQAGEQLENVQAIPQGQQLQPQQNQQEPIRVVIVKPEPKAVFNRITFNPLGMLLGAGSVNYERRLSDHVSIEISPTFVYWGYGGDDIVGGGLGAGVNFYLRPTALRGLHFNVGVLGGDVCADGSNTYVVGGRALVRYNWVWDSGFTLGLGGGIQYTHMGSDWMDSPMNGVLPAVSLNLGYAW